MKRTPIKRISPKRRKRNAEWAKVTREAIKAAVVCGVVSVDCTGYATEGHHRKLRSQGGTDTLSNCVPTCAACHRYIHNNPAWAVRSGFIEARRAA